MDQLSLCQSEEKINSFKFCIFKEFLCVLIVFTFCTQKRMKYSFPPFPPFFLLHPHSRYLFPSLPFPLSLLFLPLYIFSLCFKISPVNQDVVDKVNGVLIIFEHVNKDGLVISENGLVNIVFETVVEDMAFTRSMTAPEKQNLTHIAMENLVQAGVRAVIVDSPHTLQAIRFFSPKEIIVFTIWGGGDICSGPVDAHGNHGKWVFCAPYESTAYLDGVISHAFVQGYSTVAIIYWSGNLWARTVMAPAAQMKTKARGFDIVLYEDYSYGSLSLNPNPQAKVHERKMENISHGTTKDKSYLEDSVDDTRRRIEERSPKEDEQWISLAEKLKKANPDVVLMISQYETAELLVALKKVSFAPKIFFATVGPTHMLWYKHAGLLAKQQFPNRNSDAMEFIGEYTVTSTQWHHSVTFDDPIFGDTKGYISMLLEQSRRIFQP